MTKLTYFVALVFFVAIVYGLATSTTKEIFEKDSDTVEIGVEGYIYGYPLVLMNATKQATLNQTASGEEAKPINTFCHFRKFVTPAYTLVTSPNVDTLYSNAWLDLSKCPLLLHVPQTTGRYFIMEMLDGWTNVFADPGTRTAGSEGGEFLIIGPYWKGDVPQNVTLARSSTDMAWINLRIECLGADDYPAVHAIQDQFTLRPLQASPASRLPKSIPANRATSSPETVVDTMSADQFFTTLEELLPNNPPSSDDAPIIEKLATITISPSVKPQQFDPSIEKELEKAVPVAQSRIRAAIHMTGEVVNGWRMCKSSIGKYETDYLQRAAIAAWALGVNVPKDVLYPFTYVDSDGNHLNGAHTYKIHFDKGKTPPVNAFWSITMYNANHSLVANQLDRYAIQSHSKLQYNRDGSLDIIIQESSPAEHIANWLPCPKEDFNLILRMYWPQPEVLDGTWVPPAVIRVM